MGCLLKVPADHVPKFINVRLTHIRYFRHAACVKHGRINGKIDYVKGANIAGFVKVADAMMDQGVV